MKLHITKGCGKMEGFNSLSVSSLNNSFCQSMKLNPDTICRRCYGNKYEKMRSSLEACLVRNANILICPLTKSEIPKINAKYFRFNGFGELYNDVHYKNLCKIAKANPDTIFAIWTKRANIVMKYPKVKNMIYIYSNPFINKLFNNAKIIKWFDHIFSVWDKGFAKNNKIKINCSGKKCINCLICYKKGTEKFINELRK